MPEMVLVVPRIELFPETTLHGFSSENLAETLRVIREKSFFLERQAAENDPSYKQIIPYAVLSFQDEIFTVTRTSKQGEARLHQKVSIGIGGHINPEDSQPAKEVWESGLVRELTEEIFIQDSYEPKLVGLLNDDTVPVGQVHLGLIYRILLSSKNVTIQEQDKMHGKFLKPDELALSVDAMETWSQFVFAAFWNESYERYSKNPTPA